MSFTTRCPACGTVFRVVADQLKISDGWVRCGHCSDVFDATIHLQPWTPPARPAAEPVAAPAPPAVPQPDEPLAPPPPPPEPTPPAPEVAVVAAGEPDLVIEPEPEPEPAAAVAPQPEPVVPAPAEETIADDDLRAWFGDGPLDAPAAAEAAPPEAAAVNPVPHEAPPVEVRDEGPSSEFRAELERFAQSTRGPLEVLPTLPATARQDHSTDSGFDAPAAETAAPSVALPPVADDEDHTPAVPGFVRQAQRRAFWSSPGMRIGLGLIAVLLAGLLAGQWAVQHRHQLVAAHPPLRPAIEQACGWLGCDLQPLRRIDEVEIESAELVRRLGNFYSFDFVLRNRSALEVALPALELTLTNIGEQAVARRVFLPQDWPDAPAALAPNGRVSVSLRLSLMLGDDAPTAGYRALVFYP